MFRCLYPDIEHEATEDQVSCFQVPIYIDKLAGLLISIHRVMTLEVMQSL